MTAGERLLVRLEPFLGARVTQRIGLNLPSRKPQLWENLPRALTWRLLSAVRGALTPDWMERPTTTSFAQIELQMEVVPRNYFIDRFVLVFGVYEISGTRLLQTLLMPGMWVLDIGANSGYYSLIAAHAVGPTGRVHAFEPVSELRERLAANLRLNRITQVDIHPDAVTASPGEVLFFVSRVANNNGLSSLLPGDARDQEPRTVPAVSVDAFAERTALPRLDLVKIDVEGTELDVLRGAERTLAAMAPAVLIESHDVGPVAGWLEDHGYEVRHLHYSLAHGLELPRLDAPFERVFFYEGHNYVALPRAGRFPSFDVLSAQSRARIPGYLRRLGSWI